MAATTELATVVDPCGVLELAAFGLRTQVSGEASFLTVDNRGASHD